VGVHAGPLVLECGGEALPLDAHGTGTGAARRGPPADGDTRGDERRGVRPQFGMTGDEIGQRPFPGQ
jgi:hypothetical protein